MRSCVGEHYCSRCHVALFVQTNILSVQSISCRHDVRLIQGLTGSNSFSNLSVCLSFLDCTKFWATSDTFLVQTVYEKLPLGVGSWSWL